MSLSQNIKNLRIEKGLTQEQLAAELGVSAQAVSKWETSETYPDGALLVPLANALETSLDVLFDNKAHSMKDISVRLFDIIAETPTEDRFHIVRDICWQIEKGLFNCLMPITGKYTPNDIKNEQGTSYILNDYGFTHVTNHFSPSFMIFPEYDNSFSKAIGDGEEIRKILESVSSPETMSALLFIYRHEEGYLFEADVLAEACGIPQEKTEKVISDLKFIKIIQRKEIEIDGKKHTLYSSKPTHLLIALFLIAKEIGTPCKYRYQSHYKNKPYIK